jgi:lysophospholipase L1-like esterase
MILDGKKGGGGFCRIFMTAAVYLCAVNLSGCDTAVKTLPETDPGIEILQNEYWMKRYMECTALADRGDSEIVFLGDSMVSLWEVFGNADWNTIDGRYRAGNFGIGGINTFQLLWIINAGQFLAKTKPHYAVVLIGTNDRFQNPLIPQMSVTTTIQTIKVILGAIKAQSPHTGIILVSLLPRGDNFSLTHRNYLVNSMISHFQGPGIFYLDVYADFLDGAGNINRSLYLPEMVHLNSPGYALLTQKLLPLIP